MKLTLLYTKNTPADRDIEYLQRRLESVRIPLTLVDADSREGAALTELYDALDRPTLLATDADGRIIQKWDGNLPPVAEVQGVFGTH